MDPNLVSVALGVNILRLVFQIPVLHFFSFWTSAVPDPCVQPLNPGNGNSSLPRFYYNGMESQCYPFTYKGALGNQNNFLTKSNCESSCISKLVQKLKQGLINNVHFLVAEYANPCASGQPLTGPNNQPQSCNGLSTSSSCPSGYWCHVGSSLDSTMCCQGSEDPCKLPMAQGTGDSSLPRWYFDQSSKRCTQFTYRGLKGNQNNFVSQDSCRVACRGKASTDCSSLLKLKCSLQFWRVY